MGSGKGDSGGAQRCSWSRWIQRSMGWPASSKNSHPRARAMPKPASLVALPPIPISTSQAPACWAAFSAAPRPVVSSSKGWKRPGGSCASPTMAADSIRARRECGSYHQCAWMRRWAASTVSTVLRSAPRRSAKTDPKPSPPSLMGSKVRVSSGRRRFHPSAMAWAAAAAVRVPLNLSGTMRTRSGIDREGGPHGGFSASWGTANGESRMESGGTGHGPKARSSRLRAPS